MEGPVIRYCVVVTLFVLIAAAVVVGAAEPVTDINKNWNQWRGPFGNGVAPNGDPPVEWSETKGVKWKVAIAGLGHATPVVWGDRIFVLTSVPTDRTGDAKAVEEADGKLPDWIKQRGGKAAKKVHRFVVLCIDRATGKTVWEKTVREALPHEGVHKEGSWACASPSTDGSHVYAYFGSQGLYCLDMKGNVKWERDFGKMEVKMSFGEGSSPALYKNTIIVNWDHKGKDFIVALDTRTGKNIWRTERDEITSWSTPLVVEHKGTTQVIVSAAGRVCGYDIANGNVLWECGGLTANVTPHPVYADGIVYVMSGFRGAKFMAIDLDKAKGDVTGTDALVWKIDKNTPYCPSPLLYDNYLYMLKGNRGILTCLDVKEKKVCYGPQRLEGMADILSSPVGAKGRIYITGKKGTTFVVKHGPTFEVLAENKLDDAFTASPVIVGRELILRGHRNLYCIATK